MHYYLQTDTEEEMRSYLKTAGLEDQEGFSIGCDIDHIGPILWADGSSDNRWHTNLVANLSEEQKALLPILDPPPTNPLRIFC